MTKWILVLLIAPAFAWAQDIQESVVNFGSFGKVHLYRKAARPKTLVLFGSGDGGWNDGEVQMVRAMVDDETAIAGFNTTALLKGITKPGRDCLYPAGDLELLSKFVQNRLEFASYAPPILAGFSSGAALAYGALVQAPEATFAAVLSFGFCTDLEARKPLCKGSGGLESTQDGKKAKFFFKPNARPLPNWYAFNNAGDQACPADKAEPFVRQVPQATFTMLSGGGHGYAVKKDWLPKYQEVLAAVKAAENPSAESEGVAAGLPVIPLPATKSAGDRFVIFLSGDGGWAGFDRGLSKAYNDAGVPVLGFNSLKYFWSKKSPDQGAKDLSALIETYAAKWDKAKVTVVGFSFGAEVAPFFVSRLSEKTKKRVDELVLLSPSKSASFEFHVTDWIGGASHGSPIKPELEGLTAAMKVKCVYGEKEALDTVCTQLKPEAGKIVKLPGGHHFDVDAKVLLEKITSL